MGTRSKWRIQEDGKTSRKSNKDNKFPPLKCSSWKTDVWNEYTKTKDFIMLQNILFVKDCLSEIGPGSFNYKFHPSKLPLNHTTRSSSTYKSKLVN